MRTWLGSLTGRSPRRRRRRSSPRCRRRSATSLGVGGRVVVGRRRRPASACRRRWSAAAFLAAGAFGGRPPCWAGARRPASAARAVAGLAGQRGVGEHDPVVAQDVVGVELGRPAGSGRSWRFPNERSAIPSSGPRTTSTRPSSSSAARAATASLVFGAVEGPVVDEGHPALGGPVRQGRDERQADHLLGGPLAVGAGLRAEGDPAADPLRRTGRALAGPARALLPERLGPAAGHLGPGLGGLGAGPGRRQLGGDHLVQHGRVGDDAEDLGGEDDLVDDGAVDPAAVDGAALGRGALPAHDRRWTGRCARRRS